MSDRKVHPSGVFPYTSDLEPSSVEGLFDDVLGSDTPPPVVPDERSQTIGYHEGAHGMQARDATPSAMFAGDPDDSRPVLDSTKPGFGVAQAAVRSPRTPLPQLAVTGPHRAPSSGLRPLNGLPRSGFQSGVVEEHVALAPTVRHTDPWRATQSGAMQPVQPIGDPQSARASSAAYQALRPQQATPGPMPRAYSNIPESSRQEVVFAVGGARASSASHPALGRTTGAHDAVRSSGLYGSLGSDGSPASRASSSQLQSLHRPGLGEPRASGSYPQAGLANTPASPMHAANISGMAGATPGPGPARWRGAQGQQLEQALQGLLPADTPAAARLALHEALEPLQVAAGTVLVQAGAPATKLFLVVSGELRVEVARSGAQIQLALLRQGELAGIDVLLGLRNARATVTVHGNAVLGVLDQRAIANLERTSPAASTRLMLGLVSAEARRVRVEEQTLRESLVKLLPAPTEAPPPNESRMSQLGGGLAKFFRR